MVFADVGAHVGYFTLLAAALVRPAGGVHAFEPDPECFSHLAQNVKGWPQIQIDRVAVGDRTGITTFYRSPRPEETGWGTILPSGESRPEVPTPVTTLDEYFSRNPAQRLDAIKLDVEGAEHRVLRGAEETIDRHRPVIFFEVNEACLRRDGRTSGDLIRFFLQRRYSVAGMREARTAGVSLMVAIPEEKEYLGDQISELLVSAEGRGPER